VLSGCSCISYKISHVDHVDEIIISDFNQNLTFDFVVEVEQGLTSHQTHYTSYRG